MEGTSQGMAQKVNVQLVDDLDGSVAESKVEFGLDGVHYAIDLSANNAAQLREAVATYVSHAKRTGGQKRRGGKATNSAATGGSSLSERRRNQAIREWAREQGMDVSDRGRIPAEIVQAYDNA
jgi:hypothetical protein